MDAHPRRKFVLQIIRIIIWAVIAAALVKVAFFPTQEETHELIGQGNFELPTVEATTMDITNDQSFDASITRDEAKSFKASAEGTIVAFFVEDGAKVNAGDRILQIRTESTIEPTDPEAMPTTKRTYTDIKAPSAGTVRFDAVMNQTVAIGDTLGHMEASTFHASVQLQPGQLYALQSIPSEATITITDGPAPFTCTDLHTDSSTVLTQSDSGTSQSSTPELRCSIPADQQVFDGLKAKLSISGESATGVLALPTTAIEGRYREGNVYLPAETPGAKPTAVKVEIGINDGQYVEIKSGLDEGTPVLEFVPTLDPDDEQNGIEDAGGYGM